MRRSPLLLASSFAIGKRSAVMSMGKFDRRWLAVLVAVGALVLSIGGCVAYPAPGYYGGGYYGGSYAYAAAPIVIGRPYYGGGWGRGWGHEGYHRW